MIDVMDLMNFNRKTSTAFDDLKLEACLEDDVKDVKIFRLSTPNIDISRFMTGRGKYQISALPSTVLAIYIQELMDSVLFWIRKSINDKLDPNKTGLKRLVYRDMRFKEREDANVFCTDNGLVFWNVENDSWTFSLKAEINIADYV